MRMSKSNLPLLAIPSNFMRECDLDVTYHVPPPSPSH